VDSCMAAAGRAAATAAVGASGAFLSQQGLASSTAVISSSTAAAGQPLLQAMQSAPLARTRSHVVRYGLLV
jgi:hypothetical protein